MRAKNMRPREARQHRPRRQYFGSADRSSRPRRGRLRRGFALSGTLPVAAAPPPSPTGARTAMSDDLVGRREAAQVGSEAAERDLDRLQERADLVRLAHIEEHEGVTALSHRGPPRRPKQIRAERPRHSVCTGFGPDPGPRERTRRPRSVLPALPRFLPPGRARRTGQEITSVRARAAHSQGPLRLCTRCFLRRARRPRSKPIRFHPPAQRRISRSAKSDRRTADSTSRTSPASISRSSMISLRGAT